MITDRQEYGLLSHTNKQWVKDSLGTYTNEAIPPNKIYKLYLNRYFLRSGQAYDNPYMLDSWDNYDADRELRDSLYPNNIRYDITELDIESLRETGNLRVTSDTDNINGKDVLTNYLSVYLDVRTGYLCCTRPHTTANTFNISINHRGELVYQTWANSDNDSEGNEI